MKKNVEDYLILALEEKIVNLKNDSLPEFIKAYRTAPEDYGIGMVREEMGLRRNNMSHDKHLVAVADDLTKSDVNFNKAVFNKMDSPKDLRAFIKKQDAVTLPRILQASSKKELKKFYDRLYDFLYAIYHVNWMPQVSVRTGRYDNPIKVNETKLPKEIKLVPRDKGSYTVRINDEGKIFVNKEKIKEISELAISDRATFKVERAGLFIEFKKLQSTYVSSLDLSDEEDRINVSKAFKNAWKDIYHATETGEFGEEVGLRYKIDRAMNVQTKWNQRK